jgi:hypothetical protein
MSVILIQLLKAPDEINSVMAGVFRNIGLPTSHVDGAERLEGDQHGDPLSSCAAR